MSTANPPAPQPTPIIDTLALPRALRWILLLAGLGLLTLLVIASRLNPSPSGFGTHQQLGLPPCTATLFFGMRCPGCGMTTSWAHFMHGSFLSSMRVNPGGFLLACQAVWTIPVLLRAVAINRCLSDRFMLITVCGIVLAATAAMLHWLFRVVFA